MTETAPGRGPATGAGEGPGQPGVFRIDRDGTWYHEGIEVTHPGVLRNLYANLRAEGEAYHLQAGPLRVPVQVDDAPFVVVRVERSGDPVAATAHLSDGTREPLELGTLTLTARDVPYCRVKNGRFRARLSVAAWLQIAPGVELDPDTGEPTLVVGERRFGLRQHD
jgi:hypothetical protein